MTARIIKWFNSLGDVYTWSDWAREVKDMRLTSYIMTKQMDEIMSKLVLE